MLRITPTDGSHDTHVLRLEGSIAGQWVEELRRCCRDILHRPDAHLTLDLADVTFIDLQGLALFEELPAGRVALANCSPFAAEQLKSLAGRSESQPCPNSTAIDTAPTR
jgi:STAS domain-containing protein